MEKDRSICSGSVTTQSLDKHSSGVLNIDEAEDEGRRSNQLTSCLLSRLVHSQSFTDGQLALTDLTAGHLLTSRVSE